MFDISHANSSENFENDSIHYINDIFEEETVQAVENSLLDIDGKYNSLEDILQFFNNKISDEKITQINVFREEIYECFLRAVNRKSFNPFNKISVMFSDKEQSSEGVMDIGGPSREMFRLLMDSLNFIDSNEIFSIAGVEIISNIIEKESIIEALLKFYVLYRTRPAVEQLICGLETRNVYHMMQKNPNLFKSVFCGDKTKLLAATLMNMFQVTYSEVGSNKRNLENRIISFWRDYLLDCESGDSTVSLSDILIFAAGIDEVPLLSFPSQPQTLFLHEDDCKFPKANTCSLILLPSSI
ncbi:hypothetical protein FQR65_LT16244 [Abscondita terminalis]|nr:hypothetical protein FQR65_LT16244 [Abscondita terminalis]